MSDKLRAAVIGASGIGKHHVKWLMRAGCDVVGFVGTSDRSIAGTAETLRMMCGFRGKGYTSLDGLLADCEPQLVSVCSPMSHHYGHVMMCLVAGAHVLCEKPLVGNPGLSARAQLYLGEKLVEAARELGVMLAVNTQYAAAAEHLRAICQRAGVPAAPVTEFFMRMESRGAKRAGEQEAIWLDLAAHPISVLLALVPDGQVDWPTVKCVLEPQRNECAFDFVPPGGPTCHARILLRKVLEGPVERQFTVNGVNVLYEGRNDEDGVYCAYLSHEGEETKAQDFMEASITRFAKAVRGETRPLTTGEVGLRNLEMQLRLLEGAEHRMA